MKKLYKYALLTLLTMTVMPLYRANAQLSLKSMYFVENSTLRHRLNPAFAPLQGYVGMPLLSSINVQMEGNLGAKHLFYPLENGKLGTILHPDVSPSVLNSLPASSYLNLKFDYDIFNIGWRAGDNAFWTLDWTQRVDLYTTVPKDLFTMFKVGMVDNPTIYDMSTLDVAQSAYNQIALGFSTNITEVEGLRIGGKFKFIFGMDDAKIGFDNMKLTMGEKAWLVESDASGYFIGRGIELTTDENGAINNFKFNPTQLGLAGFGFGFDLGVSYQLPEDTPVDGLGFSFAVTDLGGLFYPKGSVQNAEAPNKELIFNGFENIDINNTGSVQDQVNEIKEAMFSIVQFKPVPAERFYSRNLNTRLYFGANYAFLKEKRMNVGVLYSCEFAPLKTMHELTLSWNYMPVNWFDVTVSYSCLNVRESIGLFLNFTPSKGVNFFIGTDYVSLRYATPYPIPVDHTYLNLQLGISFPIGVPMERLAER